MLLTMGRAIRHGLVLLQKRLSEMQLNLSFAALFVAFLTVACDSRNQNEPIAVANREPESKLLPNTEDRSGAPQLTMDPDS